LKSSPSPAHNPDSEEPVTDIRVGIIGYGLAGRLFHAPFIACTPGLELAGVVTRSPERAIEAEREYPGVTVHQSVGDLLQSDVDLVVVASPSGLHAAHTRTALESGFHVVLDKPPAYDAAEFEGLIDLAATRQRELIVFHNRRWDSEYRTVQAILDEGHLGTVHRFESRMERWRPFGKGGWRESQDPRDMGGLRYDLGPHLVDQALQLFGPVEWVWARSQSLRYIGSLDDDVLAILTHSSGVTTVISASLLTAIPGPRFSVFGTLGAAVLPHVDAQEDGLRAGLRPGLPGWGAEPERYAFLAVGEAPETMEMPYLDGQWQVFYAGVRDCLNGGPSPVTTESALATMRVLDAIGAAARDASE
jgi:predicted dehydrogenase